MSKRKGSVRPFNPMAEKPKKANYEARCDEMVVTAVVKVYDGKGFAPENLVSEHPTQERKILRSQVPDAWAPADEAAKILQAQIREQAKQQGEPKR